MNHMSVILGPNGRPLVDTKIKKIANEKAPEFIDKNKRFLAQWFEFCREKGLPPSAPLKFHPEKLEWYIDEQLLDIRFKELRDR